MIWRRDEGNALIETALVIPFFTLMMVGVCNLGVVVDKNMVLADSARAGAEYALTTGNQTNTSMMQTVAAASAQGVPSYAATATNFCTCAPGSGTVSCTSNCSGYGQPALYAQVTATASIPMLFSSFAPIGLKSVVRVRIPCQNC